MGQIEPNMGQNIGFMGLWDLWISWTELTPWYDQKRIFVYRGGGGGS